MKLPEALVIPNIITKIERTMTLDVINIYFENGTVAEYQDMGNGTWNPIPGTWIKCGVYIRKDKPDENLKPYKEVKISLDEVCEGPL